MTEQAGLARQLERQIQPSANFRMLHISILAAIIGLGAGVVAYLLFNLIAFFTNLFFYQRLSFQFLSPDQNQLGVWVILIPVIGGLIVGVMAKYGSSKIRGHGIPESMEAVLVNRSRIAPRVAILKPISAAIAIGTGGPFGAEGPIIQTGGALGSLIGQIIHTTAAERKVLLACGAAAGMSATFGAPIASVILAIELLLFEFKSRSFIPLVIASVLAASVHAQLMGAGPMFTIGAVDFGIPTQLPFYIVLGLLCGLAAVVFSKALYWIEDQFERLPIDRLWWPAIGALGLGVIGYFVPRVLGVGFSLQNTINAMLARYNLFAGHYQAAIDAANRVNLNVLSTLAFPSPTRNPIFELANPSRTYYAAGLASFVTQAQAGDKRPAYWLNTTAASFKGNPDSLLYNVKKQATASDEPYPVYLPDEMKLIKAESYARLGDLATARDLINQVRTQASSALDEPVAGLPALTAADLPDVTAVLRAIAYERRYELYMQGTRLEDMRRLPQPVANTVVMQFLPTPTLECQTNPATSCQ